MGTMGRSSSGKIRGPPVDAKTKARISKTLQQKLNKQNQTWGGSTSVKKQVLMLYEFCMSFCFVYVAFLIWKFCLLSLHFFYFRLLGVYYLVQDAYIPEFSALSENARCRMHHPRGRVYHPPSQDQGKGIPSTFLFCKNTNSQHCGWQTRHLGQRHIP